MNKSVKALNGLNPAKKPVVPQYDKRPTTPGHANLGFYLTFSGFRNKAETAYQLPAAQKAIEAENAKVMEQLKIRQSTLRVDRGPIALHLHFIESDMAVWCSARKMWLTYREWETTTTETI
jgi:hypothetical protein